jgi:hypothetical protein
VRKPPGRAAVRKGSRAELEVARILRDHGFRAWRTPNSGGLMAKGDIEGLSDWHIEVKRRERLAIPEWLDQTYAQAGWRVPLLVFRRDARRKGDPCGRWHAVLPFEQLAALLAEVQRREEEG